MGTLINKVALVTGGATGIGAAITRELAERGCRVVFSYFRSSPGLLQADLQAKGADHHAAKADLSKATEARRLVDDAISAFGSLDIVVNNAGDLVARSSLNEMELEFFHSVMAVNMDSALLVSRFALPHLLKAGGGASIVNIASLAGRKGGHGGSLAYSTAKGALITFTRALAGELAASGVRVNAVAPGLILGTHFHDQHTTSKSAQYTIDHQIPLGRAGAPEDVARAVAFLASEYDGFITGATLDINGGQYMA